MAMQIVDTLPEERWQAFVDDHPQGNIFHTPAMAAVFARARGCRPLLRAALDADGRILALLTGAELRLLGGPLARLTSRVVAYGGALAVEGSEGLAALDSLLRWHNQTSGRRALFTELRHRSDASALGATLAACGYQHEQELNFLIDLSRSPAQIHQAFSRSVRRNTRLAERNGMVITEAVSPEQVRDLYQLLSQVYRDARVPLADISLFQAVCDLLRPPGMARLILATCPEGIAGARLALLYKGVIFDWYAGADRQLRSRRPNEFLVWRLLEWGAQHGYHTFDFGGAGHPDAAYGVRDFKSRFGGRTVNYGRARCVHAPRLLRLSESGYNLLRRLRSPRDPTRSAEA